MELYELLYAPVWDRVFSWLTLGSWAWAKVPGLRRSRTSPPIDLPLVDHANEKKGYGLPREECEFTCFPPEEIETSMGFKIRVIWCYVKIAVPALIKENVGEFFPHEKDRGGMGR